MEEGSQTKDQSTGKWRKLLKGRRRGLFGRRTWHQFIVPRKTNLPINMEKKRSVISVRQLPRCTVSIRIRYTRWVCWSMIWTVGQNSSGWRYGRKDESANIIEPFAHVVGWKPNFFARIRSSWTESTREIKSNQRDFGVESLMRKDELERMIWREWNWSRREYRTRILKHLGVGSTCRREKTERRESIQSTAKTYKNPFQSVPNIKNGKNRTSTDYYCFKTTGVLEKELDKLLCMVNIDIIPACWNFSFRTGTVFVGFLLANDFAYIRLNYRP